MQAWQQVKINQADSPYHGQAGYVERVERVGDATTAHVKLDTTGEVVPFADNELQILC